MHPIDDNIKLQADEIVPANDHASKSWFRKIVMHASKFADSEIELVKAESREKLKEVKKKTNLIIISFLFVFSALIALGAALVHGLSGTVPPWATLTGLGILSLIIGLSILKSQSD